MNNDNIYKNIWEGAHSVSSYDIIKKYYKSDYDGKENILCPFHNDKDPSLKFYPKEKNKERSTESFSCFGCGATGSPIDFIAKLFNIEPLEAAKKICYDFNIKYNNNNNQNIIVNEDDKEKIEYLLKYKNFNNKLINFLDPKFFINRGLNKKMIKQYELGYCPCSLNSALKGRYTFPIKDKDGDIVAIAGRSEGDIKPKYLNSPNCQYFSKGKILYNFDIAKNYDTIYVVEGFFDCLTMVQCGFKNTVALMTDNLSTDQNQLLINKKIILCLDNDVPGDLSTGNLLLKLTNIIGVVSLKEAGVKDINELLIKGKKEKVINTVTQYLNPFDYLIKLKEEGYCLEEMIIRKRYERRNNSESKIYE